MAADAKQIVMVAYTLYSSDARVRREAETVAELPGHEVTVLALKEGEKRRAFESGKVHVHELGIAKYRGKSNARYILSYLRFTVMAFLQCTKLVARRSLDVVHVHNMPNFLVFAGLVPRLCGMPVILDVHDTMPETYAAKFDGRATTFLHSALRLEEKVSIRMAQHVVCVNDIQKTAMVERHIPEHKIVVAMNVPDPKVFDHSRAIRVSSNGDGKIRMIYHGTVTKRIGVNLAVKAVAKLNGRVPDLEFHVVGDGDDLKECKELCRRMGVENQVLFRGRVSLEELIPILEGMDLGIVPNGRNAATELMLPVKMLECVALGIPVVAPRLKTIEHYFTEDMVFYFRPDDIDAMAEAVLQASRSADARLSKAREARRFLEMYGWESHKRDFIGMYRSLGN